MNTLVLLQLFFAIDLFAAGFIVALVLQHMQKPARSDLAHPDAPTIQPISLSPEAQRTLTEQSQKAFSNALNNSATQLESDLGTTASLLDKLVKRLGTEIVSNELERYRTELAKQRDEASRIMQAAAAEVAQYKPEIQAKITAELNNEKQQLLQQIDTKLNDAVASLLVNTLKYNVDLGAQEPFLRALLEEHKDELKQTIEDYHAAA